MKKRANNLDRIIDFESEEKLAAEVKDVKPFHADSDDINDYDNDDDDLDVSNDRKVQQAKERLQKLQREKEEKERIEKEKKEKELQEKLEKEKQQKQKEQEEKEKELRLKQEKEKQEKQEKEQKEQESKQRERIEKEKKEKELQEKLEKEKQQKQKEQEEKEKEKELRLKQEKENKEKQEEERKEKEQKEKQNHSYSHNGNNHHNNHKGGYGHQGDHENHKGGYGHQDDDDNHKGGYGHQDDDDGYGYKGHKGGYGHHDDDGYGYKGHKGGYGHQDDDDDDNHKGGYGHHDDDGYGYKGHKGGYGHYDDDDDGYGYKGHKGGYGHHGKKCNSNLDCTHLTSSLCSKGVCVGGYCQKSSTNVTHLECCRDEDCNKRTDWNLDKRINSRDYPELEECNAGKCQGGVFNEKGELITSPTCSRRENCCINKEWDNYCNWPGGQATWTREACKGENCQVSTWGAIYSYPIPRHTPNFPDIVPRFLFKKNWISLYKKLIIVALNVENQFNIKKIFIQRSQSTLVSKLNEIEDFLKSACSIWSKLDPQCSIPDGITPFPFIGLLDFTNSPKFSQYDHFLDSILSGNYSGLPFCSHNHHY